MKALRHNINKTNTKSKDALYENNCVDYNPKLNINQ